MKTMDLEWSLKFLMVSSSKPASMKTRIATCQDLKLVNPLP